MPQAPDHGGSGARRRSGHPRPGWSSPAARPAPGVERGEGWRGDRRDAHAGRHPGDPDPGCALAAKAIAGSFDPPGPYPDTPEDAGEKHATGTAEQPDLDDPASDRGQDDENQAGRRI